MSPEHDRIRAFLVWTVIDMEVLLFTLLVLAALAVAGFSLLTVHRLFRGEV